MNVSLNNKLEQMIRLKVATGNYASANDVIEEALRLMSERDQVIALNHESLRTKIAAGVASLRTGDLHDGEAVFDEIFSELDELDGHATTLSPRVGLSDSYMSGLTGNG